MTTVHVVDDLEEDRLLILDMLKSSWESIPAPSFVEEEGPPQDREWRFLWEPIRCGAISKGDVVISDLYPEGYWEEVPKPTLYERSSSLPDDPTNLYKAALDVIQRFMRPIPDMGAHLIVITYIPNWIGGSAQGELAIPVLADKIRAVLRAERFEVYEKQKQIGDEACFRRAVSRANEILGERA
jgi:hypothetical protein